jgi:hypothetical protein
MNHIKLGPRLVEVGGDTLEAFGVSMVAFFVTLVLP